MDKRENPIHAGSGLEAADPRWPGCRSGERAGARRASPSNSRSVPSAQTRVVMVFPCPGRPRKRRFETSVRPHVADTCLPRTGGGFAARRQGPRRQPRAEPGRVYDRRPDRGVAAEFRLARRGRRTRLDLSVPAHSERSLLPMLTSDALQASVECVQWRLLAPGGIPEGELVAAGGEEGIGHATTVAALGRLVGERSAPGGELAELGIGVLLDPAGVELVRRLAARGEAGGVWASPSPWPRATARSWSW